MKELNIDAEMGLDAYSSCRPGEWVLDVLARLRNSSRWTASKIITGPEDDPDSERVSLIDADEVGVALKTRLLTSNQCSCFMTVNDSTASWSLPLMFTTDGHDTTLTASVYDSDLRSGNSMWRQIRSLLDLCFDLLVTDTTEWLRFGIEGEDMAASDSSIFFVLPEQTWQAIAQDTRRFLSSVAEKRLGSHVVWCSPPPGTSAPRDFEAHLAAVVSAILRE